MNRVTPSPRGLSNIFLISLVGWLDISLISLLLLFQHVRMYVCIYLSLGTAFGGFTLRERQNTRVRVEVSSTNPITNENRKFASMFAAVEEKKTELRIQEYSIAQTSLEQIFNQFAAQQGTYGYLLCRYTPFSSSLLIFTTHLFTISLPSSSSLTSPLTLLSFLLPQRKKLVLRWAFRPRA